MNIFPEARGLVCTIMKKMNQTQLSGNKLIPALFLPGITFDKYLNKGFPVWFAESLHIPVSPVLSQFTFLIRPCTRSHGRQQDSPSPWTAAMRFSWQGPASVTGLAPVTALFKCVFGVTEIPTTCTPHISAMPLC